MAIEGSLADVSLADICQLLAMGRKTGCLTVTDRTNFGYVYFDEGRVTHASVLNRPDRLGELLVRNEVVTREQLSGAMEQQAHEPGKRIGAILVQLGFLQEEDLDRYITIQIQEAVYHLFGWDQGTFQFDPDQALDVDGELEVSINAETLLLEGARRVDEWSQIEKKIPSMDLVFAIDHDPREGEDMELTSHQEKILSLLDGERSVKDLVNASGLVEFDAVKALYELNQAGFVRQAGRRSTDSSEEDAGWLRQRVNLGLALYRAGMLEDAEREFTEVLDRSEDHPAVRGRLGLIALRTGRYSTALEHFDTMAPEDRGRREVLMNRALALEELDRLEEAEEILVQAGELGEDTPELLLAQAIVKLKRRDGPGARALMRRYRGLIGEEETPSVLYYAYAVLASAVAGKGDEAVRLGREGLAEYQNDPALLVNTGVVLEHLGEEDAAEIYYIRAAGEAPAPAQAHKNLGDRAYDRGDHAGARAHYERAVEIAPRLGDDVLFKLGSIAYKEGDGELAGRWWRRAVELDPTNEMARANLRLVSSKSG